MSFYAWVVLALLVWIGYLAYQYNRNLKEYKNSEYFKNTQYPYQKVIKDLGLLGEYYTYLKLRKIDGYKKFLFNCYLPKDKGDTTEIDVIMLHEKGIFVFESKNYSGWIFGSEEDRMWTQSIARKGKRPVKTKFFNPVIQNTVHIKWLKNTLQSYSEVPCFSFIVFSERCSLKKLNLKTDNHTIVKRNQLIEAMKNTLSKNKTVWTQEELDQVYDILYPLTQISEEDKQAHIERINEKIEKTKNKKKTGKAEKQGKKQEVKQFEENPKADSKAEAEPMPVPEPVAEKLVCPRCKVPLVERTSRKKEHAGNTFYGCSNFPKCRYIKPIENLNNTI